MSEQSHELRAEALFASPLQRSDNPSGGVVRAAVESAIDRYGSVGCAALVAGEFGEHPDTARSRMRWALDVVDGCFPQPA
jgi:hypothetical protein